MFRKRFKKKFGKKRFSSGRRNGRGYGTVSRYSKLMKAGRRR